MTIAHEVPAANPATNAEISPEILELAEQANNSEYGVLFRAYDAKIKEANAIAEQVRLATHGDKERIETLLQTGEEFSQHRAQLAQFLELKEKLDAQIAELIQSSTARAKELLPETAGIDVESAKSRNRELRQVITATRKSIEGLLGKDYVEAWIEVYGTPELIGFGRSQATGGARKPRFESATVNGESLETPTLSEVSKITKIETPVLLKALTEAAGTDDFKSVAGRPILFALTKGNANYSIEMVAK